MEPSSGLSPGGSIAVGHSQTAGSRDEVLTNEQLGIIVGLMSTSVQSLGLTLQRKSHILEDEKPAHDVRRPPYRRRRWQLGMGMFIVANLLGSSIQISTLPLPVLSTLQAAGLVFNSICATLILSEPFTSWSLGGTLLVSTGAVLIAIFGAIPSPAHDLDELLVLLGRKSFIVWMILQAFFALALAISTDLIDKMSSLSHNSRFRLARGIAYGVISGDLSAHSLLFAKSAVELVIKTIGGKNQFVHWQAWAIVMALVSLALCQLYYLHRGLKLVSTSVLYPLVFCVYNIIAILDGLIYFDQIGMISTLRACIISLGTVILLTGVLALSWRLSDEQHTPGVGQSTLAPGLGLVEDTEGEEESLLSGGTPNSTSEAFPAYQTFNPPSADSTSLTPTKKKMFRWAEDAEIWGELEDQEGPTTPTRMHRASTLPVMTEASNRRSLGTISIPEEAEATSDSVPKRLNRRRRRSTGFPGLVARRNGRRRDSTLLGSIASIIPGRWWNSSSDSRRGSVTAEDSAAQPGAESADRRPLLQNGTTGSPV